MVIPTAKITRGYELTPGFKFQPFNLVLINLVLKRIHN
jgi:hypothetical protein